MTQTAIRLKTTVLPGRRIEFTASELTDGQEVEISVNLAQPEVQTAPRIFASAAEYLASLPVRHRTSEEWAAIERELKEG